jgi:hypothetical protein
MQNLIKKFLRLIYCVTQTAGDSSWQFRHVRMVLVKRSAGLVKKREIIIDKTIANLITQYLNKIYPVSSSSVGTCAITLFTGPPSAPQSPLLPTTTPPYSRFFARAPPFSLLRSCRPPFHPRSCTPLPRIADHAETALPLFTHFLHPATLVSFQILRLFRFPPIPAMQRQNLPRMDEW